MLQNLLKTSFFILSTVLLGGLLNSSHVEAQSVYDDVIVPAGTAQLLDKQGNPVDVSNSWYSIMQGDQQVLDEYNLNNYRTANTYCDFEPTENASWALTQVYNQNGQPNGLNLIWINNDRTNLSFHTSSNGLHKGLIVAPTKKYNSCYIESNYYLSSHVTYVTSGKDFTSNINNVSSRSYSVAYNPSQAYARISPVFINWDIDYPPDYEGEIPPANLDTEEEEKIGVSIRGSVVEDIVQIEYYHDPDNPAPQDAKGMYLVLHNANFDEIPPECSNQNIQEWRHSLNIIAVFDPVPCYGMWYVQSYYTSDAMGQNIIPNTDKTNLNIRIDGGSFYFDYIDVEYDEDGSIISPPIAGVSMDDCVHFIQSLPFVEFDFKGCFTNMQKFIGIAGTNNKNVSRQFNEITIPAHESCGSFTKLDEFLYTTPENNWLCPQLTDGLRQPITFFAVFLLYLGAMFGWFKLMSGRR